MRGDNNIPKGWVESSLGEVVDKMYSGGTPSTKRDDYYNGNIPWIRTQEVTFNRIKNTDIQITELGLKNSSAKYIPINTVIVAMYGNSAGRVAISKIEATTNQACCNIISKPSVSNAEYIYYNLLNRYEEIKGRANGAAQQNLSVGVLKYLEICLPPFYEQQSIASILTSFDDKIELLQAQNETLEAIAQTIFKEWFGKYQVGDELPEGWRVESLGCIASLSAGGDRPKNVSPTPNENNKVPIYSNGITNDGLYGYTDTPTITDESITVSARGTIGFICLRTKPFVPIVRLVTVIPFNEHLTSKYLFYWLKNANIEGTGTTQQQLTIPDFKRTKVIIPKPELINEFTKLVNSFYDKIEVNYSQIQTLQQTRDTLLPKLMSGKLRVEEFNQIV